MHSDVPTPDRTPARNSSTVAPQSRGVERASGIRPPVNANSAVQRALNRERAAEVRQSELFTRAATLFREGKYGMARRILDKVQSGPNAGLGHRARVYIDICNQKTARKRPKLETLDEYYNYAVKLLNDGAFADAVRVCNRGLALDAEAAHVHYLKAVAKILAGQTTGAVAPLKKAIALDPKLRMVARQDPDLTSVIRTNPFAKLTAI